MIIQMIFDFLHNLAAVAWIGGIIYANLVLMPSLVAIEVPERGKLMGAATKRFALLSWLSIIVLIITGFAKSFSPEMTDISQGEQVAHSIKYVLFACMLLIGVLLTFVVAPKMKKLTPQPGEKPSPAFFKIQKQIVSFAFINMILGVLVLLVLAWPE